MTTNTDSLSVPPVEPLTVIEAASRLRKDPETIRRYIRDGYIKAARVGREYRIPQSEVARLLTPPRTTEPLVVNP